MQGGNTIPVPPSLLKKYLQTLSPEERGRDQKTIWSNAAYRKQSSELNEAQNYFLKSLQSDITVNQEQ